MEVEDRWTLLRLSARPLSGLDEDEPEPEDLEQGIPSRSALKVLGTRHRVKYRSNMITLTRQNHINFKSSIEKVPTNDKYGNLCAISGTAPRAPERFGLDLTLSEIDA